MTELVSFSLARWDQAATAADQERAHRALEDGHVLLLPQLPFEIAPGEARLLSDALAGKGKNISYDPARGTLRGSSAGEADLELLRGLLQRYAAASRALMRNLLPRYESGLQQARTSFRPAEIEGRVTSWRKDDTRLHVDSFPSSPTRGRRILRVFSNVNPNGQPRTWRLGESFDAVARRYLPTLPAPLPGSSVVLRALRITKDSRSAYDHFMLGLHDRMKADAEYQARHAQALYRFESGCSWIVFTDQVPHAAMSGQFALEQTFHMPVQSMRDPAAAPLRVLEGLLGRALV